MSCFHFKTMLIAKKQKIIYYICVCVFLSCQISITLACSLSVEVDGWVHDALVFDPRRRRQVWRFGSYVLLHQGAAHAALNIVIQLLLATPLEREQKWTRTALVYFGGGLAGKNCSAFFCLAQKKNKIATGTNQSFFCDACCRILKHVGAGARLVPGRRLGRSLRPADLPTGQHHSCKLHTIVIFKFSFIY